MVWLARQSSSGPKCTIKNRSLAKKTAALDDPSVRVCILDKVLATVEEVLCMTLNLEALDKSKNAETRAKEDQIEWEEQTKRDKYGKVAAQSGLVPDNTSAHPVATASLLTDYTMQHLQEALGQYTQCINRCSATLPRSSKLQCQPRHCALCHTTIDGVWIVLSTTIAGTKWTSTGNPVVGAVQTAAGTTFRLHGRTIQPITTTSAHVASNGTFHRISMAAH